MVFMTVLYTPSQLRDAVGIGQETYRHWKKALTPLRQGAGHSPCFTVGDLLATTVVKVLVSNYGIRISALSVLANGMFEECNARSWPTLERSLLVLDVLSESVLVQSQGSGITPEGPVMVVPLRALIERLRRTLLASDGNGQEMLRFPPVAQPADPLRRRSVQA